jgi:hypothetical protein
MTSSQSLADELLAAVREWEGVHPRPLFGWRGFMVGRRVFGCCHPEDAELVVWTKLPPPEWEEAMATPLARQHPLNFRHWLELRVADAGELETVLSWLHQAYEWVRDGEPPS